MRLWRRIVFIVLAVGFLGSRCFAQNNGRPAERNPGEVRLVPQLGHGWAILSVSFSPDGRFVLTGSSDHTARLWDAQTGAELRIFASLSSVVNSVAFSPDGRFVLSGSHDKTAKLWDAQTGAEIRAFSGHSNAVWSVAFSPDGRFVLTGSLDHTAKLWDAQMGTEIRTLSGHSNAVTSVAYSPDGRYVITGSEDDTAKLWDAQTGAEIRTFSGHSNTVSSVAFSPDGRYVLTGSADHTAKLWEAQTGAEIRTFSGHSGWVWSVAFSPDGRFVLTGSLDDCTAKLWDAETGAEIRTFSGHSSVVSSVAFSRDGRFVLTGSYDKTAKLWNAETGAEIRTFSGHSSAVLSVAFSRDGRFVLIGSGALSGSGDKTARLWDAQTGAELRTFSGHSSVVSSVAFSADGCYVLTGSSDKTAKLWDAQTGAEIRTFSGHSSWVTSVAFSPDGRFVLTGSGDNSGSGDKTARLWDAQTGVELRTFSGHSSMVMSVAFSPDGGFVLTGSGDKTVKLWDAQTGAKLRTFSGHSDAVVSIAFSSDGRFVLTGSYDKTAKLWDAQTGAELRTFSGHSSWVSSVAFSPDGRFILTGSLDGTARLWDIQTGREICSLISFDDGTWAVVAPDGRFDTNNLEEMKGLHWIMSDDPMKALPLEIFMRDYYEPRLLPRLLNGERFPPIRSLMDLNRTQPTVKIADTTAQTEGKVTIAVEVARGKAVITRDGKPIPQVTDVYDVRLFRDGQLVATSERTGGPVPDSDLPSWRERYRVSVDPTTGRALLLFKDIKLPRKAGKTAVEFTAYAFNEDRVKSPTDKKAFELSKVLTPVKGRAYVITMGVNTSQNPVWELQYAANDARKMQINLAERLNKNSDYKEVVPIPLISDRTVAPGEAPATKANLRTVLELLAGKPVPDRLRHEIPRSDRIREATPNDLVIITFSGHGYAGDHGIFYLLPEDVGPGQGMDVTPELLAHCVSSEELAEWLRDVDAGDMAMIVDACHSAASVEGAGFKPGPMGSRGLGQLAFDKGMRILAASQANSVALESNQLEQGLLSYALVHDGLEQGKADYMPRDRVIMLSEWLSYGTNRVPILYEEIRAGKIQGARGVEPLEESGDGKRSLKIRSLQQPALFDFTKGRRDVWLEEKR